MTNEAPEADPTDVRGLLYEYGMIVSTAGLWANVGSWGNNVVQNAIMESCLIHARNMQDFLGPPPARPRKGDYFAADFVQSFEVVVFDPEVIKKINRWLHHLTTYRYRDDDHPSWSVSEILPRIVQAMDQFLGSLDEDVAEPLMRVHRSGRALCDDLDAE